MFLDITLVNTPEVCVNRYAEAAAFDADGNLVGENIQGRVADMLDRLVALARKFKSS